MEAQALQLGSLALRDCCHIGGLLHPYVSGDLPAPELEVGWDQEANGFVGLNWRSEPQQHCWRMLLLPRIVCVCAPRVIAYLKLKLCSLCGGGEPQLEAEHWQRIGHKNFNSSLSWWDF